MTKDERRRFFETIKGLPDRLSQAVAGMTDQQLDTPYRDGGWSVRQVVHHLADSHTNALLRIKWIVTEDGTTLKPYAQEDWAELADSKSMPVQASLDIVRGVHARAIYLMERLGEAQWDKIATHPERGKVTAAEYFTILATHGENHLNQILNLKNARGW